MSRTTSPATAFAVAAAGIGFFSLMDVAMKDLSIALGAYNAVIWRNMAGAIFAGALFLFARQGWPDRSALRLHAWRSLVVAIMAISFFWAIARLPLAEAIGLSFIAPVIALFLAAILLGEKIGREAIIASVAGLAGVAVILFGKFSGHYSREALWGVAAVLFSAVVFAYNLILARQQAQIAGPIEIAFFQNLLTASILALAAPWLLEPLPMAKLPILSGAALLAILSLLLLSWAYARAEAQVLIPVEYTGFVWAAIFGWLFFAEPVTVWTIAGTALIVAGSLVAARVKPEPINQVEMAST
ncbi:MAG: DMT family transporter [Sphingobium sp.]|jgi:S-adenosylmethionine uptake transporter|nr:MAG: DMT family transporter [Sphingobium sp.]